MKKKVKWKLLRAHEPRLAWLMEELDEELKRISDRRLSDAKRRRPIGPERKEGRDGVEG